MGITVTWYGHATWLVDTGSHKILIDPFLDESPTAPIRAAEVDANTILISHGHFDHVADAASIANRTGATLVAIYEIAEWFAKNHDVKNTIGMNIGGQVTLDFGTVKMTPARHSSQLPDGSYGGVAAGFLLTLQDKSIYFACDTGLFGDMQLIGQSGIDLAVLPIGDLYTMGPQDSILATQWIKPKVVIPAHFNTWPPIEQDAEVWAKKIQSETVAKPVTLNPGDSYSL